ncbi:MAG: DUF3606 domain-containing protein [Flavisolibacter sp.]
MGDNKDLRDGRDRSKVSGNEAFELRVVAEKWGVSQEEVKKAIEQVGNSRDKVEDYLRTKTKNR